jgi:hypothetical protein
VADIDCRIAYPALPVVSLRLEPAMTEDRDGIVQQSQARRRLLGTGAGPSSGEGYQVVGSSERDEPRPHSIGACQAV